MKALILVMALLPTAVAASETQISIVRVVRLGVEVVGDTGGDPFSRTIALLESCTIDSTSYAASRQSWDAALAARSLVHVKFAKPQRLEVADVSVVVNEILVPLPQGGFPLHLFVRSGDTIRAFTKYRPIPLKQLVWDAALALSAEPPYSSLESVEEN